MNTKRSVQLEKMRSLYELREERSRARMHEQLACVTKLEDKVRDIQVCVDEFVAQLNTLDDYRLHADNVTVALLQEASATRLIVERDLRKERFYLDTACKDVSEAVDELRKIRTTWRNHSQRLDALTELEKKQHKLDLQQSQLPLDRELDDLVLTRYGSNLHG